MLSSADTSVYGRIRQECTDTYLAYLYVVSNLCDILLSAGDQVLTPDDRQKLGRAAIELERQAMKWWVFVRRPEG
jgi:hypothetical protein